MLVNTADLLEALAGTDYTAIVNQTATITAGTTSTTVTVQVTGETLVEIDETFNVNLSDPKFDGATDASRVVIGDGTGLGTIVNDDMATFSIRQHESGLEDGGPITFTIDLSNPVDQATSVTVSTADGTALVADNDYTPLAAHVVHFAAGQLSATFQVLPTADNKVEADETFTVALGTVSGGYGSVTASGASRTGTILNDDFAPVAHPGGPYVINEGDSLHLDASASTDADDGFVGLTFRWDVDGDGDFDENVTGVSPTLTRSQLAALGLADGPYTGNVTVEASDGTNISTASTTLTVNNVAPTLVSLTSDHDETCDSADDKLKQ